MKYVVIVPDGAADYPIESLGGRTPLEAADTPNMDKLATEGIVGRVKTVPKGFIPASDVANLALLGYEPQKYYSGRAPFEAANMGIELGPNDVAFRCNLVTESDENMFDYSAGHITTKEAKQLIERLDEELGTDDIRFYPGISYRHLLVFKNGAKYGFHKMKTNAPHDIMGQSLAKNLPKGKHSEILIDLMKKSRDILMSTDINKVRIDLGDNPANMIWLWGQGVNLNLPTFQQKFGISGGVISAVDLINGIGRATEMEVIKVEGATGYYDTNYAGKAREALDSLERNDLIFIHIEAPDEAGHNGDLRAKMTSLEKIDKIVLGAILKERSLEDTRILVSPDHFTPVSVRTHTAEPVPFVVAGNGIPKSVSAHYSEEEAQRSNLYFEEGALLMEYFIK